MCKSATAFALVVITSVVLAAPPETVSAGEGNLASRLAALFSKTRVDVKTYECDECGELHAPDVECIERVAITECVEGKKKVYDCQVRYEYVSIPEVRYRWKTMWVTKEIPCDGCVPVCKTEDGYNCFGAERWDKDKSGSDCCSELHCRSIEHKHEKMPCKCCEFEPGETTIKVRYKTCVKEPYTVYRRVKRPVCVKIPGYEKVDVPIVRHECCGLECDSCDDACGIACTQ